MSFGVRHSSELSCCVQSLESRELLTAGDVWTNFGIDGRHDYRWYSGQEYYSANLLVKDNAPGDVVTSGGRIYAAGHGEIVAMNGSGQVDTTFGIYGYAQFFPGIVRALAVQADGKLVAAGNAGGDANKFSVARYTTDGQLDLSFSNDGWEFVTDGTLSSVTVDANGQIVLVGTALNGDNSDFKAVRLTSNGERDLTFGINGAILTDLRQTDDVAMAVAVQLDGKTLVAGSSKNSSGEPEFAIVRYNGDGTLDESFDGNGKRADAFGGTNDVITSLTVQTDEKIVVAGYAVASSMKNFAVARYTTNGNLDTTFSGDGKFTVSMSSGHDYAGDVAVTATGTIVIAGGVEGARDDFGVVRLSTAGVLDTTFSGDGKATYNLENAESLAWGLTLRSDGGFYLAGQSNGYLGVVRVTSAGALSTSFSTDGILRLFVHPAEVLSSREFIEFEDTLIQVVLSNLRYVEHGVSSGISGALASLTPTGLLNTSFNRDGLAFDNTGLNISTILRARRLGDGTFLTVGSEFLGSQGDEWRLTSRNSVGDQTGFTWVNFGTEHDDVLHDAAFSTDGDKIVVVGQSSSRTNDPTPDTPVYVIARFNSDRTFDPTFSSDGIVTVPWPGPRPVRVHVMPDGRILILSETVASDQNLSLSRYHSNGTLDTSFGSAGSVALGFLNDDEFAADLEIDAQGRIVVGGYSVQADGDSNFLVARVLSNGQPDTTFDGDGLLRYSLGSVDYLTDLVIQPDGRILTAGYQDRTSDDRLAIARLTPDGTFDNSFSSDGKLIVSYPINDVRNPAIAVRSNGQLLLAAGPIVGAFVANEAPTVVSNGSTASVSLIVNENSTAVTTVQAADINGGPFTYHIAGGSDADRFQLHSATGVLEFLAAPDFETLTDADGNGIFEVQVYASDGWLNSAIQTLNIAVAGVPEAPHELQLSNTSVEENSPAGTVVGLFSSLDQDHGSVHSYSLVTGAGDNDNSLFAVNGNQLTTAGPIDFEANSTLSIRIRTTDAAGLSLARSLSISVLDRLDGTNDADAFHLRYSANNVAVSISTNGGPEITQGTYVLTSPLIIQELSANDSVFIYGTDANDTFLVGGSQHSINGAGLVLDGSASVTLIGAAGNDLYRFDADASIGSWSIDDSTGIDHLDFSPTTSTSVTIKLYDTLAQTVNSNLTLQLASGNSIENATGTQLDDIIFGNALNNTLRGLNGVDDLAGHDGNDWLIGGSGDDQYRMHAATQPETDRLVELENGGIDRLYCGFLTTPITINLGLATPQVTDENRTMILSSTIHFENVVGGSGHDTLIGNAAANSLYGSGGNDTIDGMGGDDSLSGFTGSDIFVFSPAMSPEFDVLTDLGTDSDFLAFGLISSNITLNIGSTAVQAVHTNRTLKLNSSSTVQGVAGGIGNDSVTGNALDNTVLGNGGNDTLRGMGGNDQLFGGSGNDTYVMGATSTAEHDHVTERNAEGTDTLNFSSLTSSVSVDLGSLAAQVVHANRTLTLSSNTTFENVIGGSGSDSLTGNFANNTLTGNAGSDVLQGQGGSDSLLGGLGDDVYAFDTATTAEADQITEATNGGIDWIDFGPLTTNVNLNVGTTLLQNVHENRTLKLNSAKTLENAAGGSGDDTLRGNSLANVLVGNAGKDSLVGLSGRDLLIGGLGLDKIYGGTEDDILIAGSSELDSLFGNLNAVHSAWLSTDTYATRIDTIRNGVGSAEVGLRAGDTVVPDTGRDYLSGSTESDWFFKALDDVITDLLVGEIVDLI